MFPPVATPPSRLLIEEPTPRRRREKERERGREDPVRASPEITVFRVLLASTKRRGKFQSRRMEIFVRDDVELFLISSAPRCRAHVVLTCLDSFGSLLDVAIGILKKIVLQS